MKKILFICCLFAAVLQISAQNLATRMTQANSTTPSISLADQLTRNSTWLTWASNIDAVAITTAAFDDIIFVQRFTTSDLAAYNGFQLSQIAFYVENSSSYPPSGNYSIKVYQGGSYSSGTSMSPGTLVYSQSVPTLTYDDLTYVTLNTPITINASQELWFGVEITNIDAYSYMMGFDNTSTNTGKGSIYYNSEDMAWYDINSVTSLEVSAWAIEAYAVDPNGENDAIIDLGLWYIDNATDQNTITDMTVPYGSNFVPIPVVWNYNFGDAVDDFQDTLHFELTLDGSPLGSTGASTVYIGSGAGVYWNNYVALYASDIAYYNLYGTHTFCMTVSTGPGWYENDPSDNTGCITVTFEGPTATNPVITVLNTDGSVYPSGNVTVTSGSSQTFTITPSACNTIADVFVDGVSVLSSLVNNTFTFTNVTTDHTFQVVYNSTNFNLTASTNGNGNVNPMNNTVGCGANQTFTFTPNPGYIIDYVTDNTIDVTAQVSNNSYTLTNIQQDHAIFVAYTQDASVTYTLTATAGANGSITPTNVTVNGGATQAFNISPNAGYAIDYVTDNTVDVTAQVSNNVYTLTNISANHDIYVAFTVSSTDPDTNNPATTYVVTVNTDGNATVNPGNATVNAGDNLAITIMPNNGYHILTVTDNNIDVTAMVANNIYTIANINENHAVNVTCEADDNGGDDPDDPDNPDGIANYTLASISVFPNPAADVLNLQCAKAIESVEIYDLSGKMVYRSEAASEETAINVSQLTAGVYFIKAITDGQIATAKFVKK